MRNEGVDESTLSRVGEEEVRLRVEEWMEEVEEGGRLEGVRRSEEGGLREEAGEVREVMMRSGTIGDSGSAREVESGLWRGILRGEGGGSCSSNWERRALHCEARLKPNVSPVYGGVGGKSVFSCGSGGEKEGDGEAETARWVELNEGRGEGEGGGDTASPLVASCRTVSTSDCFFVVLSLFFDDKKDEIRLLRLTTGVGWRGTGPGAV